MKVCQEITIPPMSARAFMLRTGQSVRVVDVAGRQPGDLVVLAAADHLVRMSQARTRVESGRVALTAGDALWSNTLPPRVMLRIVADSGGPHDLLYPPCCRFALEKRFGVSRDGCGERLAVALAEFGVAAGEAPEPLNLFFRVTVDEAGAMRILPPASPPGAAVELKAEMDCLVAVSTCSAPWPGKENSGYQITILEAEK